MLQSTVDSKWIWI